MEESAGSQPVRRRRPGESRNCLCPQATAELARAQRHERHAASPITIVVSRSATSDGPNTTTTARLTTAVSGGKSTYPNAR